ncbi:hypothetical protein EGR_10351 [Echinococcus granulosus]|uniref:Uncharacterized protein n=1 Tax=Echinococcus granulosus TaxID=6210 RepID=W6U191_ECHGR|nr:hypothetical protein EGR_10351 [Echinococcus granulosus]EUB54798.1 hypothetical protein EGR_10351 [Echinococcus granulosus]
MQANHTRFFTSHKYGPPYRWYGDPFISILPIAHRSCNFKLACAFLSIQRDVILHMSVNVQNSMTQIATLCTSSHFNSLKSTYSICPIDYRLKGEKGSVIKIVVTTPLPERSIILNVYFTPFQKSFEQTIDEVVTETMIAIWHCKHVSSMNASNEVILIPNVNVSVLKSKQNNVGNTAQCTEVSVAEWLQTSNQHS